MGGGPTGVETAGALAELINHVMAKDYPYMDLSDVRVLLIEAAPSVMMTYPDELREATNRLLRNKNVEIMVNTKLVDYNGRQVTVGDGKTINAAHLIWTAGVRVRLGSTDTLGVQQAGLRSGLRGRGPLQLPGHLKSSSSGDAAYVEDEERSAAPMLATVVNSGVRPQARTTCRRI